MSSSKLVIKSQESWVMHSHSPGVCKMNVMVHAHAWMTMAMAASVVFVRSVEKESQTLT